MVMGVRERQGKQERLGNRARAISLAGTDGESPFLLDFRPLPGWGVNKKVCVLLQMLICR